MSESDEGEFAMPTEDPIFAHARVECPAGTEYPLENLLPIVVGAHLRAEVSDRPIGDRIARHIRAIRRTNDLTIDEGLIPVVISDIWYLNDSDLMLQPSIVVGEPGVNAASAHWAARIPKAFSFENSHQVLMDLEGPFPVACMWGVDHARTEVAADHFERRYLHPWLESVAAI
jgi:hypothetical protein